MKPILEWLKELPETHRQEAVARYDESFSPEIPEVGDVETALACAFNWSDTPQGFEYWDALYHTL